MKKEILIAFGITILFLGTCITPSVAIDNVKKSSALISNGNTLYVGGSGEGNYTKIQDAIDDASDGDTVFVYNGTYCENIDITKNGLNLIGEDKNTTIIYAGNEIGNNAVKIENHNYITISNFTIQNVETTGSIPEGNGVYIYRNTMGNTISNCIIHDNPQHGIYISAPSPGQNAIDNSIKNCLIYNSGYCGIRIETDETTYVKNTTILNTYIAYNGISSSHSPIGYKSGISSSAKGEVSNTFISGCYFKGNFEFGIYFAEHSEYGANVNNNYIFHNNFLNDTNNAYDECTNFWNSSFGHGNYWHDYTGTDADGDGIGDTPYPISGVENVDNYPLMHHCGPPYAEFIYDNITSIFDASLSGDYDGEIVNWTWSFGDGTIGYGEVIYHKYCDIGTYRVTLKATDNDNNRDFKVNHLDVKGNILPTIEIDGPSHGRPNVELEYDFILTDPDDDEIFIMVEWGDGPPTEWMGPYSPEPMSISHKWEEQGLYFIRVNLKDVCGETGWSDPFWVEIPRYKMSINSLFLWLLECFPMLERLLTFFLL
ncbi:MAG: PKD domain-containing protein [Thermoplasmatales archaeon]|nr:MAG: PKD domain-containing protein [Thermoplasmatales archaeon]